MDINGWVPFWSLSSLLIGLMIGSFINVVIYRLPKGQSLVFPRSRCPKCKMLIRWWDNIPVLSFVLLKGKCRNCQKKISPRYPVVEILTGVLFLACQMRFGVSAALIFRHWPLMGILVAITFIDLQRRIIPDPLSLGGLALGLATCWMVDTPGWLACFGGAALGFGLFYALAWFYERSRGRSGLGGGDVKLLAMIGAYVGPSGVFATVLISSILGSLIGLAWAFSLKRKRAYKKVNVLQAAIPFGPFLVIGGLYYYLLGDFLWFQFMSPM